MLRGIKGFSKELNDFAHGVPRGAYAAGMRVATQWFNEVVDLTPVDTGFASSMWKYSVNSRPSSTTIKHPSPGKGSWSGASTPTFRGFHYGDTLYVYNNVEYMVALENGHSQQAPRNFFHNSSIRAGRRLQREYNRLRWRNGKLT